ncbi:MAG TPA: elongation factor G [Candidatus Kryptonia bacterium]|nr:elongation factor G [Candidatus Kryptonia bacterium]
MPVDDVGAIRNLGIVGQGGVGKTALGEVMLFDAGVTTRIGRLDDGTSAFGHEPEEVRRQLTLSTAFHHVPWRKHEITLLDMPGYANFVPDALNCMRAATGLVFVLAPAGGEIKVEAEQLWKRADELQLARIAFVTKMDRERADFNAAIEDLKAVLGGKPVPVQLPIGAAETFRGAIDLVGMRALIAKPDGSMADEAIPADLQAAANAAREQLMELVAEADDALLEKYLETGALGTEEIQQALTLGTRAGKLVPVLCGSAGKNIGVPPLLDAVVAYLPSPAELGNSRGSDPKIHEPIERAPSASEPFSALVFKTIVDPFAGKLSVFRVLSGRVNADSTVLNVGRDTKERLGHLFKLEGKKQQSVPHAIAGEIVAVAKLKDTASGDTLADERAPILYPGMLDIPTSMSFAIEPKSKGDEEKATTGLHRMIEEDLTLHVTRDPETREIILSGVGQLHIEVAVEKLKRKYGVEVTLKAPKVPYRETIKGRAEAQGKLKKQSGGRGQFADTYLKVEPLPRGTGFEFVDAIVGGVVPRQFIPAVEKGIREALNEGIIAHYPVVDVKATLYDGSFHTVDSSEMAFKIAASLGFKTAMSQAKPILLEPMMNMEIQVPDDCMGDVIGDLNSRRGKVLGVDPRPGGQVIRALVPMAEVLKYAPDLRSMTSGRGSFTMGFDHYDEVPAHLTEKIIKEAEAARAAKA